MKLCKDCKYCELDEFMPRCSHPSSSHLDVVTGDTKLWFCNIERLTASGCGPDAKNWEAKS
jgi:hypothetical protein